MQLPPPSVSVTSPPTPSRVVESSTTPATKVREQPPTKAQSTLTPTTRRPIQRTVLSTPIPTITPQLGHVSSFTVDRSEIELGECTTLRWDVRNVREVYLWPDAGGVAGEAQEYVICPRADTTYTLELIGLDGEHTKLSVSVRVVGTLTPTPIVAPTSSATSTSSPTIVPATATPSPVAMTATPTGIVFQTLTPTP